MKAVTSFVVCILLLLLTVGAQIDVSLFSDAQCTVPLPSSALLFNSVQAWSSLSSVQLVAAVPTTSDSGGLPPVSNLTTHSCQTTAALRSAGVGVGVYSCAPPNVVPWVEYNASVVYPAVIALAEWPSTAVSSCPSLLAAAPQQVVLHHFTIGANVSAYAPCEPGTLTINSNSTIIYSIVYQACQVTSNQAGLVKHGWLLYGMLSLSLLVLVL